MDLLCLSHLRWDLVFQRPQHLMTRAARDRRVLFCEEPVADGTHWLELRHRDGVLILTPHVRDADAPGEQRALLDAFLAAERVSAPVLWYYTPAALAFTRHLRPSVTVYDCMDELSAFRGARPELRELEAELFARTDLVFTGGQSLFEAKRQKHPRVHAFPSSVDAEHFRPARSGLPEAADQAGIPRPRIGFFGVLDERLDQDLVAAVADARPSWQIVLIGPVVKIEEGDLPRRPNIHYLGARRYAELPRYIAGWDVSWMPFALNEATRFISPTKVLEYMAAGTPVVSTAIRDVVRPYGGNGLVRVAEGVGETIAAVEAGLADDRGVVAARFDELLAGTSWDRTWARMDALAAAVRAERLESAAPRPSAPARGSAAAAASSGGPAT